MRDQCLERLRVGGENIEQPFRVLDAGVRHRRADAALEIAPARGGHGKAGAGAHKLGDRAETGLRNSLGRDHWARSVIASSVSASAADRKVARS